mmetsp:Transcript_11966/g.28013  ORF Transcript_11966/g.28013 Transcript_11966/m.28013 type:complete len:694 (+) Transcript_11966:160-2241(+)
MQTDRSDGSSRPPARAVEVLIWALQDGSIPPVPAPEVFRPAATVVSLACGGGLAAFLTADRRVYLTDLRPAPSQCGSPRIVEALREEDVAQVACGKSHAVMITVGGAALLLTEPSGSTEATRAEVLASRGTPVPLPLPLCAVRVSCGDTHTLITTDAGVVFSFGSGSCGQLGLGAVSSVKTPTRVQGLSNVQVCDVAAGSMHSCAVTTFGNIFVWGDNSHSQLGDGTILTRPTPYLLQAVESVAAVSAAHATAVLCSGGIALAWGFPGCSTPRQAFEHRVRSISVSQRVLCAVGHSGELIVRDIDVAGAQPVIACQGALSVASALGHITALAECAMEPVPTTPILLPPQVPPLASEQTRTDSGAAAAATEVEIPTTCGFAAPTESFGQLLEEVTAEHLKASAERQGTLGKVESNRAANEETQAHRLEDLLQRQELQAEVANVRNQVIQALRDQDRLRAAGHRGLTGGLEVQTQHEKLTKEHQELSAQQEALQRRVEAVKGEVAENNGILRRLEDACSYAQQRTEREKAANARLQAEVLQLESTQLHTGKLHVSFLPEAVQLKEELGILTEELREGRSTVRRMEAEVAALKDNCAQASRRVHDLRRITADGEWHARTMALEMQHHKFDTSSQDSSARIDGLRHRLSIGELQEAQIRKRIHESAVKFAEDMKPQYAEVQRLHAVLARMPQPGCAA